MVRAEEALMAESRQKLIGLLDCIEQVVRLDERVAFRLSEYHLPDGSTFAVGKADTQNLPSVRQDHRDEEGAVWLEVERLSRKEPPLPPTELAEWIVLSADPAQSPEVRSERMLTVSAVQRDAALVNGEVRPDDVLESPRKRGEPENAEPVDQFTVVGFWNRLYSQTGKHLKEIIHHSIRIAVETGSKAAPETPTNRFKGALPTHVLLPLFGAVESIAVTLNCQPRAIQTFDNHVNAIT
jgi:hypothetical protein